MKLTGTQSTPQRPTPQVNPDQFNLEELHGLATDPDFKVSARHARKLGVMTFEAAEALLKERPLSTKGIIAFMKIMRSHLMWLVGPTSGKLQSLSRELSDAQLQALDICTGKLPKELFRAQVALLVETVKDILEEGEEDVFLQQVNGAASHLHDEREIVEVLFPLLLSATVPAWEKRAVKQVRNFCGHYSDWATRAEQSYYAQVPLVHFVNGHTARVIREFLKEPKKFGLSHGALSGTYAIQHVQGAMLCEVVGAKADPSSLAETLQLDAKHLQRLRRDFADLVHAQTVADLYANTIDRSCDRDDLFRNVHFAIQQGDESLGLAIDPKQLLVIKNMLSDKENSVIKLHRQRMRKLLLESLNKVQVDKATFAQWHYPAGATQALTLLREHLRRVMNVNYRVFSNVYAQILETEVDRRVTQSLLTFENDNEFRNWVHEDLQNQAYEIRAEFRKIATSVMPIITAGCGHLLVGSIRRCLMENQGWKDLYDILQGGGPSTDFVQIKKELDALFGILNDFRNKQRRERYDFAANEKTRILPHQLKSGFV